MKYSRKGAKVLAFFQPEVRPFSLLISLDAAKFDLLSFLTLMETICPKMWSKSRRKNAKKKTTSSQRASSKNVIGYAPSVFSSY